MFRKYEKTYRALTPQIRVKGKLNLDKKEVKALLGGKVVIEEKMDGVNTAIIRSKKGWTLQKRRGLADEGSHPQFSFFWQWARHNEHKILKIKPNDIIYGELMFALHHVYYDELPSYFLAFDVWSGKKKKYLKFEEKHDYLREVGLNTVPTIDVGYFNVEDLDKLMYRKSCFASKSQAEGIVVKNYKRQIRAKVVRPEFMKKIGDEGHWMHKSIRKNKLLEGVDVYA